MVIINVTICSLGHENILVVHYSRPVSGHGLLFDDVDELEGVADGRVWIGPFRALEMSNL